MDLNKIIRELLDERDRLDRIVASLEQLAPTVGKAPNQPVPSRRGRKSMDPKAREEVSERMKNYWASRRKNAKP